MKKTIGLLILTLLVYSCSETRAKKGCPSNFTEMADPTNDTLSDWSNVEEKLHASFVSIDDKYPKSVNPIIQQKQSESLIGWKGETVSAQILVWTAIEIKQLELKFSDFKSETSVLKSDIAQARFVRYVMTDEFADACGKRKPEDYAAALAPDMLDNLECFDLEAKAVRPVWITVTIPSDAEAGNYLATINLSVEGQEAQDFELKLDVQNHMLAKGTDWDFHLDFWQHPSAVARVQNLEMWSDEHFEAMKPIMKRLADAGQKVITATLNKDPWNNQCYDAYADMIVWTKLENGVYTYDYTNFDKWVQFMLDLGVDKMINCYSMVPWNNELHYVLGVNGEVIDIKADPGTKEFEEIWVPFLPDFVQHLKEKGWLEITNIAMDERNPKDMASTLDMLSKSAPELGIALADNHKSYKRYPFIKDMCVGAGSHVELADMEDRRARGLNTTYYVCCAHGFPNVFTFSGAAEAVYMSWYAIAAGYDGMLHWSYNSWVENPLLDSRFRTWPAGDTYIVYPENRSSIRFERLLEGLQDVEKVKVLRAELAKQNTDEAKKKLKELNEVVTEFNTIKPSTDYVQMLHKAKKMINDLSR